MSHACQILTFDILQARDANAARMVAAWLDEQRTPPADRQTSTTTLPTTSSKKVECKRRVSRLLTYLKIHRMRGALIHPLECHFVRQPNPPPLAE